MTASVLDDNTGTTGEVNITWDDSAEPANFYAWRLYHRPSTSPRWTKVYETTVSQASYDVDLYSWANKVEQQVTLVAVTQSPTTGALTEGTYGDENTFTPVGDDRYTLVHPTTPSLTVVLKYVTTHKFDYETEHKIVQLLNTEGEKSGRKINRGTYFGETGTIAATFHDDPVLGTADVRTAQLEALQFAGGFVYLRDPFGKLVKIFLETVGFDRIPGVGDMASVEIDISYAEVL